ncbi:small GTP-binding protein, putative [Trichomonas vaginalis G3]|uniref:Small GTP-binding protein, putative n=1 Tax=Trichomonas vaginalis (strain ATCC PRA-98 / G3) TaxID=412133 RepID=A2FYN2_TRIV3|nr:GTPase protein [Trichomonas vaginalis G3]EAX89983.1 small GTP-binding protein, putative [Trichomonas vaginalis G3]KAI5539123.1 GTPase protein [Trichomonas vaginalis G3]|eukprot:XP_001302913.1 small GTP-binding protein [Trichomonas vaginalis G3]
MTQERKQISFKLIVIGDSGVGKTSLVIRQSRNQFSFQMAPTIGTSHIRVNIPIEDYDVELKIWDTAGQEQFAPLVSMYARGATVCIIVASSIDTASVKNIATWKERLKEANEDPAIVIALNKADMVELGNPTLDQIREELHEKYENIFSVSAKTGEGVNDLFTCAAKLALENNKERFEEPKVSLDKNDNQSSRKCC